MPSEVIKKLRSKPWMVGIMIGIVLAIILWSIYGAKAGEFEKPVISSPAQYNDVLNEAAKLSEQHLVNLDKGETLTAQDKVDLSHAALDFDALTDYHPNNIATYTGAGKIYQNIGKDDLAIVRFHQGLQVVPKNPMPAILDTAIETHYLYSVSLFNIHQYPDALIEINNALGYIPTSPIYLTQRARIYIQMGKTFYGKASEDLVRALGIDSSYAPAVSLLKLLGISADIAFTNSANAKLNKKDFSGAVADCTAGIKMLGNTPSLLSLRAAAYIDLGKKDLARKDVADLEGIDPEGQNTKTLLKLLK